MMILAYFKNVLNFLSFSAEGLSRYWSIESQNDENLYNEAEIRGTGKGSASFILLSSASLMIWQARSYLLNALLSSCALGDEFDLKVSILESCILTEGFNIKSASSLNSLASSMWYLWRYTLLARITGSFRFSSRYSKDLMYFSKEDSCLAFFK